MKTELEVATRAALAAGEIICEGFGGPSRVQIKSDGSPVTEIDRAAEKIIIAHLQENFPDDAIYAEESGGSLRPGERTWLIDPLDGTKSFIRGYDYVSVQIALWQDDHAVIGVSHAPLVGETMTATEDRAWLGTSELAPLRSRPINEAHLSIANLEALANDPEAWATLGRLLPRLGRVRGFGDYLGYHLLARGCIDIAADAAATILDVAAVSCILRALGCEVSDLRGQPLQAASSSFLAAPEPLHEHCLIAHG